MDPRVLAAGLRLRARLALLLVLCVLCTLGGLVFFARALATPHTGLVVNYPEVVVRDGRVVFSPKVPFSPAVSAGLRPNRDEILSVEGAPVHGTLDVVRADNRVRGFEQIRLVAQGEGEQPRTVTIRPAFTFERPDWLFVLLFIAALSGAAFVLTFRIPDEPGTLPLVLAALTYLVFTSVKPFYYESLLSNGLIHMGKLTSWLLVFFGLYFPRMRGTRPVRLSIICLVLVGYAAFIAVRISYYLQWTASGAEGWLDRYRFLGQIGNVSDAVAYLVWAALMVGAYLKAGLQAEKKQLQWILAGILIALPPYFFFEQLPLILGQSAGSRFSLGSFAEMFLAFIPLFIIIGLTRHRMFNIRYLLTRYALYGTLFLVMFGLFSLCYLPLRGAIAAGYGADSPFSDFLAAAVLLAGLAPIRYLLFRAGARVLSPPRAGYTAELERRNAELSLIIEQLRLQGSRSFRAEKLSELKAILRGITERIRGPLREVSAGLASAVRGLDGEAGGGSGKSLAGAVEASIKLTDFTRVLESLSGSPAAIPAVSPPGDLVQTALQKARSKFPAADFSYRAETASRISCFPAELVDALCFVLENAIEAQDPGDPPVQVRLRDQESRVTIEIADAGCGTSARSKVFRPFFSTKPGHQGLGLYFARLITERVDGSITLESRAGEGTRVCLAFPSARPPAGESR